MLEIQGFLKHGQITSAWPLLTSVASDSSNHTWATGGTVVGIDDPHLHIHALPVNMVIPLSSVL